MDDSLKKLEIQLENLVPRAQSEDSRDQCHALLDDLVRGVSNDKSPIGLSRMGSAIAASVALSLGIGGGWYLGKDQGSLEASKQNLVEEGITEDFDQLDHETWMVSAESPGIYVSKDGEVREILQETEITKKVVQHRESGIVVTVETTDHHLIDSLKSDF